MLNNLFLFKKINILSLSVLDWGFHNESAQVRKAHGLGSIKWQAGTVDQEAFLVPWLEWKYDLLCLQMCKHSVALLFCPLTLSPFSITLVLY